MILVEVHSEARERNKSVRVAIKEGVTITAPFDPNLVACFERGNEADCA